MNDIAEITTSARVSSLESEIAEAKPGLCAERAVQVTRYFKNRGNRKKPLVVQKAEARLRFSPYTPGTQTELAECSAWYDFLDAFTIGGATPNPGIVGSNPNPYLNPRASPEGRLYRFLIYGDVLTEEEIAANYEDGLAALTTTPPTHNRGDVTGEGFVGADDLVAILTNWGGTGNVPWENGDIAPYGDGSDPGDDFVGADDYVEVLTY